MLPDEPFPNFRASKSVDRRILCSSESSNDGSQSSKMGKGLVNKPLIQSELKWKGSLTERRIEIIFALVSTFHNFHARNDDQRSGTS